MPRRGSCSPRAKSVSASRSKLPSAMYSSSAAAKLNVVRKAAVRVVPEGNARAMYSITTVELARMFSEMTEGACSVRPLI